jgi:cytohesin
LLQTGASANARDADGFTALSVAAERGNLDALRAMLKAGADVGAMLPIGESAIHRAALFGHGDAIDVLIAGGADPDTRILSTERRDGWTPLMVAAAESQVQSVQHLLAAGAYPDARNRHGRTALLLAAWYGSGEIVAKLVAAGANPDAADAVGLTPLKAARFADPTLLNAFHHRPQPPTQQ